MRLGKFTFFLISGETLILKIEKRRATDDLQIPLTSSTPSSSALSAVSIDISWNEAYLWNVSPDPTAAFKLYQNRRITMCWHSTDSDDTWKRRSADFCALLLASSLEAMYCSHTGMKATCLAVEGSLSRVLSAIEMGVFFQSWDWSMC